MSAFDTALRRVGLLAAWTAGACLILMMVEVVADVTSRTMASQPLPSTIEIVAAWWMPALIFLPMAAVAYRGENIAVDIVYDRLPPRAQAASDLFACLCFAGFLALVGWAALEQAMRSFREGEFLMGTVPVVTWPARFLLPLAAAVSFVVYVLHAVRAALRLWRPGRG